MARLGSIAKMGYYPTPPEVVRQIRGILRFPEGRFRAIDTCCGEGDALNLLTQGISQAETFGVELDKERFKAAREKLAHVLWADSLWEFSGRRGAFQLLWLNPPYDTDESIENDNRKRLEYRFLEDHLDFLGPEGILIYIVPWDTVRSRTVTELLGSRMSDVRVYPFPYQGDENLFERFGQTVLIARRHRPSKAEQERTKGMFDKLAGTPLWKVYYAELISTDRMTEQVMVPEKGEDEATFLFRGHRFDPDPVFPKVEKSSLWQQCQRESFPALGTEGIRPLTPLREGHLAMLLASGMMNGEVASNGERLIVKGSVKKTKTVTVEEIEDGEKTVETDHYNITVRAIGFSPEPEIFNIQ